MTGWRPALDDLNIISFSVFLGVSCLNSSPSEKASGGRRRPCISGSGGQGRFASFSQKLAMPSVHPLLVLVSLLRVTPVAGVTWPDHSSHDTSALQTDNGVVAAYQYAQPRLDELAVAAVDQAYMVDRASAQKIADAEEEAGAIADIAARSAAKAASDAGWAALAAQTTEAAVQATEAAQKAQEALAARAAEKMQMAAQVAQAAVAHREDRTNLERSHLELQAQQKAQLAFQVAEAAVAQREERIHRERSDLGVQTDQKAQVATQVAQAALAARAERSHLEQSHLELQAAIAQDNLQAEQKAQAALAALAAQAEQKAVGDSVRPKDRNAMERLLYPYTRHVLSPEQSGDGVCLDGSPPGFYYSPAPAGSKHNNSWVLYLAGGAWCTDKDSCLVRSRMELGSSVGWGETLPKASMKSWLSSDPTTSQFHDFHKAVLMYCDGASFSGHVDSPVSVGEETVYFRGRLVLAALIRELGRLGLGAPNQEVLLSGGSAGGLAAILQGDRVKAMLPRVAKFKVPNPNPNPNP